MGLGKIGFGLGLLHVAGVCSRRRPCLTRFFHLARATAAVDTELNRPNDPGSVTWNSPSSLDLDQREGESEERKGRGAGPSPLELTTVKERPPSTLTMSLNDTDRVAPSPNRAAVLPDLVIPGLLDCSPARPLLLQASANLQRNSGDRREKRREQPPVASRDPRGRRCSGAGRRRRRVERVIAGLPSPPGGRIHRQ